MNKFTEKLKDLFYDTTDYAIMMAIVVCVSGIIWWRLDSLFAEKENLTPASNVSQIENVGQREKEKNKDNISDELIEKEKNKQKGTEKATVKVNIPAGSLPNDIADILLEHEVITDTFEFLRKSQEMGLDKHMKSGTFEFNKDESVEDVIKKVCKL